MAQVRRLVLDILKPRHPNVLDFGRLLAAQGRLVVRLTVLELDDKTETLRAELEGDRIDFERIEATINDFGASLHSIDEVEIEGEGTAEPPA